MARTPLIAGNWKMNLDHVEAIGSVQKFAFSLPKDYYEKVDVAYMVPFTDIRTIQTLVEGDKLQVTYGAQDISKHESGAFTGEVSGKMLAKLGCSYVVIGHSERREHHAETDAVVHLKVKAALAAGLAPIVCVGESSETRAAGEHLAFVTRQVAAALEGLSAEELAHAVIAYEPVWAIGTGKTATPDQAQAVHALLRAQLHHAASEHAAGIRILYGGSMNAANAAELLAQPDIDGGLIGGAALKAADFLKIVAAAA